MVTHSLTEYPKDLAKKVTLLQHFRSYLENNTSTQQNVEVGANKDVEMADETTKQGGAFVYVKKWMRTKHAIMFRLSNKIVQVNFQDHTEILLNSESRLVTYVNKKGERQTLPLNVALESNNAEMTKRLKYTKDILTHMLNNGGSGPGGSQTAKTSAAQNTNPLVSTKRDQLMSAGGPLSDVGGIGNGLSTAVSSTNRKPLNVLN